MADGHELDNKYIHRSASENLQRLHGPGWKWYDNFSSGLQTELENLSYKERDAIVKDMIRQEKNKHHDAYGPNILHALNLELHHKRENEDYDNLRCEISLKSDDAFVSAECIKTAVSPKHNRQKIALLNLAANYNEQIQSKHWRTEFVNYFNNHSPMDSFATVTAKAHLNEKTHKIEFRFEDLPHHQ